MEIIGPDEKISPVKSGVFGIQHFMALISGGAIVPALLMGLDPSIALMCTGIGTLIFLLVTKGRIPAYLGVSFTLISAVVLVAGSQGIPAALGGVVAIGVIYIIIGAIIKATGTGWLTRIFPPVVTGSIIACIGIGLAPDAISMVFKDAGGFSPIVFGIGMLTLISCIAFSSIRGGFISTLPVLLAIVLGYIVCIPCGLVDFQPIADASWLGLPNITTPVFDLSAILCIAPIAFVIIVDHLGKILMISGVCNRDYIPMLPKSLIGNGIATAISGALGGPAITPIAENIGVMGVSRVYAVRPYWVAATLSLIAGGFCPKFSALLLSIPDPVLGGVSLLLFGMIAANGIRMFVDNDVDFGDNRNMMVASVTLIVGIGMMTSFTTIPVGEFFTIPGLLLATILAVVLNVVVPSSADAANDDADPGQNENEPQSAD